MCDKKMKKLHLFKYNIGEVCEKMRIFEAQINNIERYKPQKTEEYEHRT